MSALKRLTDFVESKEPYEHFADSVADEIWEKYANDNVKVANRIADRLISIQETNIKKLKK